MFNRLRTLLRRQPTGRKIFIVGFASTSRDWVLEQEPDVEIWALNELHDHIKTMDWSKASRWFQIHPDNWKEDAKNLPEDQRGTYGRGQRHVEWMSQCNIPVYMNYPDERIPTAVKYPLEDVRQTLGVDKGLEQPTLYLTSSPAFMFALALHEHIRGATVDEIRIAGIDLSIGTEYFNQRPCMEYYMGLAKGMGIKVTMPPMPYTCTLLGAPIYSLDEELPKPADWSGQYYNLMMQPPETSDVKIYEDSDVEFVEKTD